MTHRTWTSLDGGEQMSRAFCVLTGRARSPLDDVGLCAEEGRGGCGTEEGNGSGEQGELHGACRLNGISWFWSWS